MTGRSKAVVTRDVVGGILSQLRERRPVVLCLGNVRADHLIGAVRALGAILVTGTTSDLESTIGRVDAVVLWPALSDAAGRRQMEHALAASRARGTPVVIDAAGVMRWHRFIQPVQRMISTALWPVVSATGDEMASLAGSEKLKPARLAGKLLTPGGIAAVRGHQGVVTDGRRVVHVGRWNDWLDAPEQAALAGAIIGAFLSAAHLAGFVTVTAVALGCLGHAADRASHRAKPEAMRSAIVEELAALSNTPLVGQIRITESVRRSAKR